MYHQTLNSLEHIVDPFLDALEKGHIRSMPNSFLPPAPVPKPGLLLLGDALNMRHPLTGAGMSVALNDALMWRELLSKVPSLQDHARILQCSRQFQWQRKLSHSFVVNVLAQALYALFSASDGKIHDPTQLSIALVHVEVILCSLLIQSTFTTYARHAFNTSGLGEWLSLAL